MNTSSLFQYEIHIFKQSTLYIKKKKHVHIHMNHRYERV